MAMKLMTKKITRKLLPLGATDGIPVHEKKIAAMFFTPWTYWTWYVVEGECQVDGDYLLHGYITGDCKEWGDFFLSDLMSIAGPFGMHVERDKLFRGNMGDVLKLNI